MPLPTTGRITLGDVRNELNKTGPISLGSSEVRTLAGKASGIIKMSDLYGKSDNIIFSSQLTVGVAIDQAWDSETYGYDAISQLKIGSLKPNNFLGGILVRFYQTRLGNMYNPFFQVNNPKTPYPNNFITIFPNNEEFLGSVNTKENGYISGVICPYNDIENERLLNTFKKYANQTITIKIKEVK